jgi:mRNA-degrading endonuclease RelE of RelBE toxin-antitoxin system
MNFEVIHTRLFEKELKHLSKKYQSFKSDFERLYDDLQKNPRLGMMIGEDLYKIRLAIQAKIKASDERVELVGTVQIKKHIGFLLIFSHFHIFP